MFKNSYTFARRHGAKLAALPVALVGSSAFAQTATTMADILDAVDLSMIAGAVGAAGLVIVGVALLFKAPVLSKRIISKV